jgi:L-cystine transport system permease protein
MEMTGKAQTLGSATQHFIETYIALALVYLVISFTLRSCCWWRNAGYCRHEAQGQSS